VSKRTLRLPETLPSRPFDWAQGSELVELQTEPLSLLFSISRFQYFQISAFPDFSFSKSLRRVRGAAVFFGIRGVRGLSLWLRLFFRLMLLNLGLTATFDNSAVDHDLVDVFCLW